MAFMSLEVMPPRASLAVDSEPSSFGTLACVHDDDGTWCLMQDGRLVNWTGLGFVGYSWTEACLVSEQPTAPGDRLHLFRGPERTLAGAPRASDVEST